MIAARRLKNLSTEKGTRMTWDYADLSHMAKEAGGPDLLLSTLEKNARGQGRIEGAGIGAIVAGFLFVGAALIYGQYSKKKALTNEAKAGLANGIRAYEMATEGTEVKESAIENEGDDSRAEKGEEDMGEEGEET